MLYIPYQFGNLVQKTVICKMIFFGFFKWNYMLNPSSLVNLKLNLTVLNIQLMIIDEYCKEKTLIV